jgi:hypothetical protein
MSSLTVAFLVICAFAVGLVLGAATERTAARHRIEE